MRTRKIMQLRERPRRITRRRPLRKRPQERVVIGAGVLHGTSLELAALQIEMQTLMRMMTVLVVTR